jgi:hypothetical protein
VATGPLIAASKSISTKRSGKLRLPQSHDLFETLSQTLFGILVGGVALAKAMNNAPFSVAFKFDGGSGASALFQTAI